MNKLGQIIDIALYFVVPFVGVAMVVGAAISVAGAQ